MQKNIFQPVDATGAMNNEHEIIFGRSESETVGYDISPGDSLQIKISFFSSDTGSFSAELRISNDDPLGNDQLTFPITAHAVAPVIELTGTMSVVTFVGNDVAFIINIQNPGGWQLDYTVDVEANWFGFGWMDVSQPTGQIAGYSTENLIVDITNTSNLDPGAFQGFVYFNTNTGSDPDQIGRTDTVSIYMTLLADDSQLSQGSVSIPSGNASPITVLYH